MTAPPPRSCGRLGWLLAATLVAGCGRKTEHGESPPAEPSNVAPAPSSRTPLDLSTAFASADLRVEARRGLVDRGEPLLEPHRQILERHFGGALPLPLAFQAVASGGDRVAVLLQATAGEGRPMALLLTRAGEVVWSKDHPMGGVKPGASEPAIASGPNGHVALAWCNASTKSVALREWADDGGAFADYEAMHFDTCDALSVLYWPKRGWVIGVAWQFGAILQRLSENGETVWGRDGLSLPWNYRGSAPVSLGLDSDGGLMLFRLGRSGGDGSPEYLFASRYGPDGESLWPGPLSVLRLDPPPVRPSARVQLEPASDGAHGAMRAVLSAEPSSGALSGRSGRSGHVAVEVAPDGAVIRRRHAPP